MERAAAGVPPISRIDEATLAIQDGDAFGEDILIGLPAAAAAADTNVRQQRFSVDFFRIPAPVPVQPRRSVSSEQSQDGIELQLQGFARAAALARAIEEQRRAQQAARDHKAEFEAAAERAQSASTDHEQLQLQPGHDHDHEATLSFESSGAGSGSRGPSALQADALDLEPRALLNFDNFGSPRFSFFFADTRSRSNSVFDLGLGLQRPSFSVEANSVPRVLSVDSLAAAAGNSELLPSPPQPQESAPNLRPPAAGDPAAALQLLVPVVAVFHPLGLDPSPTKPGPAHASSAASSSSGRSRFSVDSGTIEALLDFKTTSTAAKEAEEAAGEDEELEGEDGEEGEEEEGGELEKLKEEGATSTSAAAHLQPAEFEVEAAPMATPEQAERLQGAPAPSGNCKKRLPRPKNAYIIYSNERRPILHAQTHRTLANVDVSRMIGAEWKQLSPAEQAHYFKAAEAEKREFMALHPDYKFVKRPNLKKRKLELEPGKGTGPSRPSIPLYPLAGEQYKGSLYGIFLEQVPTSPIEPGAPGPQQLALQSMHSLSSSSSRPLGAPSCGPAPPNLKLQTASGGLGVLLPAADIAIDRPVSGGLGLAPLPPVASPPPPSFPFPRPARAPARTPTADVAAAAAAAPYPDPLTASRAAHATARHAPPSRARAGPDPAEHVYACAPTSAAPRAPDPAPAPPATSFEGSGRSANVPRVQTPTLARAPGPTPIPPPGHAPAAPLPDPAAPLASANVNPEAITLGQIIAALQPMASQLQAAASGAGHGPGGSAAGLRAHPAELLPMVWGHLSFILAKLFPGAGHAYGIGIPGPETGLQ